MDVWVLIKDPWIEDDDLEILAVASTRERGIALAGEYVQTEPGNTGTLTFEQTGPDEWGAIYPYRSPWSDPDWTQMLILCRLTLDELASDEEDER